MRGVYQVIDAVAPSTAACHPRRVGHGKSRRPCAAQQERAVERTLFALNCAALLKEILENELFGHEKGALPVGERAGRFEMAAARSSSTKAEMSPDIQVGLLQPETRQVRRLGGKKEISVDIRIVAHEPDLQQAIDDDTCARILPSVGCRRDFASALRERTEDIHLSRRSFCTIPRTEWQEDRRFRRRRVGWIRVSLAGNVRELKNAVERAVIATRGTRSRSATSCPASAESWRGRRADVGHDSGGRPPPRGDVCSRSRLSRPPPATSRRQPSCWASFRRTCVGTCCRS